MSAGMARMLLIDNAPGWRRTLRTTLEDLRHEVDEAKTGREAPPACRALSPALVWLELFMPDREDQSRPNRDSGDASRGRIAQRPPLEASHPR